MNLREIVLSVATLVSIVAPSCASAQQDWPVLLRERMTRVSTVAWRLSGAAHSLCPVDSARTGLMIDYVGAYSAADRAAVAALLGLGDLPQVAAVAPGSAAHAAGLQVGDDILAVDGVETSTLLAASRDPDLLADQIEERLASAPAGAAITLRIRRSGIAQSISMLPDRGCPARFIVTTGKGVTAFSDPQNVALDSRLVEFTRTDDELALVAGHELAHVINGDARTKGMSQRAKEDRADALGAALARCAGYDLPTALEFWPRFKKRDWLHFLRAPTHRSIDARIALIRARAMSGPCPPPPTFVATGR